MASITLKRRSALTGLSMPAKAQAIAVSDAGAATRFVYRGPSSAVETAFALSLPTTPCRAKARDDRAALWLGPDEWLLIISSDAVDFACRLDQVRSDRKTREPCRCEPPQCRISH